MDGSSSVYRKEKKRERDLTSTQKNLIPNIDLQQLKKPKTSHFIRIQIKHHNKRKNHRSSGHRTNETGEKSASQEHGRI